MAKNVMKIPARVNPQTAVPIDAQVKRKVAGYARVSTDHDEQLTSYEAQLDYYTTLIKGHDDWEFAGMYSESGFSGTQTARMTSGHLPERKPGLAGNRFLTLPHREIRCPPACAGRALHALFPSPANASELRASVPGTT